MSVETYRYFFSALIQVFGTIIAVNAIFLVLRHEFDLRRLETIKKKLAVDIVTYEIGGLVIDYMKERGYLEAAELPATYVSTYSSEEIQELIDYTEKRISEGLENSRAEAIDKERGEKQIIQAKNKAIKLERGLKAIKLRKIEFRDILDKTGGIVRTIVRVMTIPAALSVILSIGLLFTEQVHCIGGLFPVAIIAIILSIVGFALIIQQAAKTFRGIKST
ncbi:MAG: hypothetical protein KAU50_08825 [Candidatus Marinimicrobia bacterium]|nr:hypothetical protein [Candidatus Neomarinimicrobiota bacterium]